MTPQEKAVTKALRRHQRDGRRFRDLLIHCACGWKSPELMARKGSNDFAAAREDQAKSFERHVTKAVIEAAGTEPGETDLDTVNRTDLGKTLLDSVEALERSAADESVMILAAYTVLRATANALKGESEPLTVHTWHDLERVARELVGRVKRAEAKVAAVREALEDVRRRGEAIQLNPNNGSIRHQERHARAEGYREAAQLGLNALGVGA